MTLEPSYISVVHLLAPSRYGGLESVVTTLAHAQATGGDTSCVAAVITGDEAGHPFLDAVRLRGIDLVVIRVGSRGYLEERRIVRDLLQRRRANVLHTHGSRVDVVDGPLGLRMGIATVSTAHGYTSDAQGTLRGRIYAALQRRAFRRFDAVIAVSEKLRYELVIAGVRGERVHTVKNAWEPVQSLHTRAEARRVLAIAQDTVAVGWVGRMGREKGPDVMIRAAGACRQAGITFSMIGSGPMEVATKQLAASLGIAERIIWHGAVSEAARYLRAFDVMVLTSWTEGTPIALLEAITAGVPVVTTAVGGIPDVVSSNEALLVAAGDADAIAAGIEEVLSEPEAAAERAATARRRLLAELSVGPWVERIRDIYASVLRRG